MLNYKSKNSFVILFLLISLTLTYGCSSSRLSTTTNIDIFALHQIQRESLFEKFNNKNKIVFIGDSLTDGCEWNELLGRNDVVNRGIGADTTGGVLNRIDFYLSQKPKSIFLMIGINDINSNISMDTTKTNYAKIIDKILGNNVQLCIQSTLNTNRMERNKKVEILNNFLVEQCKLKSIQYIDVNVKLSENNVLSPKYSNDGLHLNGDGYLIWKQVLLPYVRKLQ